MITTLHTLNLASVTHHTSSPRVRLRRLSRAQPQLTRPRCSPRCCTARCACRSCASPLAHPSSQRATRPLPATRRPRASRRERGRSSPGRCCSATARRPARRWPRARCSTPVPEPRDRRRAPSVRRRRWREGHPCK